MKVTIFDYGAGNLHSLAKALEMDGVAVEVQADPTRATETDVLVLPGVGAFGAAVDRLAPGRETMRKAMLDGLPTIRNLPWECSSCSTRVTKAAVPDSVSFLDASPASMRSESHRLAGMR